MKVGMKPQEALYLNLVNMTSSAKAYLEIKKIVSRVFRDFDHGPLDQIFKDTKRLFSGTYPGFRKCNVLYHDLTHTTDCMLAMTRLMHGAYLEGIRFTEHDFFLAIVSAMFHDSGYIQERGDKIGTGAKYTRTHIKRSIDFMTAYFAKKGLAKKDARRCRPLLLCTGLENNISQIKFPAKKVELMGKMLAAADLLGQMADRLYLERLLFLFYEFKEGEVGGYRNERDLLEKTMEFYTEIQKRIKHDLSAVNKYLMPHFKERWQLDVDLYEFSIEKNIEYLRHILKSGKSSHRKFLRRGNVVKILEERGLTGE